MADQSTACFGARAKHDVDHSWRDTCTQEAASWCTAGRLLDDGGGDPGLPACCISLHSIQAVTEVISLGLATTVFPAAMAGAIFQVSRKRGKFQGLIRPAETQQKMQTHEEEEQEGLRVSVLEGRALTHSHRAADGVVQAAHVVHLAALGQVMEHRGGEEAEVVRRARDVHGPGKGDRFTWKVAG